MEHKYIISPSGDKKRLKVLLSEINRGIIKIPTFNNSELLTNLDDILKLFQGIYYGYPQSVWIWIYDKPESNEKDLIPITQINGIDFKIELQDKDKRIEYLLDHTIIKTLWYFLAKINDDNTKDININIYFDLEERKFTYHNSIQKTPNYYFPIRCLNTPSLFRRELHRIKDTASKDKADFYENEIEKLFQILHYEFKILYIQGNNTEVVKKLFDFHKLNK